MIGFWAPLVTTVLAVLGGVWAFSIQKGRERQDELRRERQRIYVEYLNAIRNREKKSPQNPFVGDGMLTIKAIEAHQDALSLVAPDPVWKASLRFIQAHARADLIKDPELKPGKPYSDDDLKAFKAKGEPLRLARQELILQMRIDVLKGSNIPPQLTPVDEATQ